MSSLSRILQLPAGRVARFVAVAVWVLIAFAAGPFSGKLDDVQKNEQSSFLPGGAESVRALKAVEEARKGDTATAITVFRRDGGLRPADRRFIARQVALARAKAVAPPARGVRGATGPQVSRDGTTALTFTDIFAGGKGEFITGAVDDLRGAEDRAPPGLQMKVTGPAGFGADAIDVFNQINGTLLLATLAIVFVLLIIIYRSPIFWMIPLFSVVFAEITARGIAYGLAKAGVVINGQSAGILPVLVFGAGTDYALLLVARYREELRRHESKTEAMRLALRRAGPPILASALTVIAGLLCLTLAEVNGTSGMGPIGAMGIAVTMLASLTLLPALLVIAGRRWFWPRIPHVGDEGTDETHGAFRRLGERIRRRPRAVWIGTTVALLAMGLGMTQFNTGLTQGNSFRGEVESVKGQKLLDRAFPAGANAPIDVVVADQTRVRAVQAALRADPRIAAVPPAVAPTHRGAVFQAILRANPYSERAFNQIPGLRRTARAAGGQGTLIGGPSAQERDLRISATRDNRLIIPIVLVVVFLILVALLRAVAAPLLLIGTVILSFFAAMGVGALAFEYVFDFPGSDPALLLLSFIFLVALGVDYNIFLMARVREETIARGTRLGMVRGLAVTGAVITSAGIVLAGTFSALAVLPLVFLTQMGFVVAFGVLLDTLVVRSILVPALVLDIGRPIWWPSRLARAEEPPLDGPAATAPSDPEPEAEPAGAHS